MCWSMSELNLGEAYCQNAHPGFDWCGNTCQSLISLNNIDKSHVTVL